MTGRVLPPTNSYFASHKIHRWWLHRWNASEDGYFWLASPAQENCALNFFEMVSSRTKMSVYFQQCILPDMPPTSDGSGKARQVSYFGAVDYYGVEKSQYDIGLNQAHRRVIKHACSTTDLFWEPGRVWARTVTTEMHHLLFGDTTCWPFILL